jgi:oligosaccharide repeat unit polymerase
MLLARRDTGTWANPVGFYAGPFLVVALGQEAILPDLPFSAAMAMLILGSTIALFLGMLVTLRRPKVVVDPPRLPDTHRAIRTIGLVVAFAVALVYLYEIREARATGLGMTGTGLFDRATFFAAGGQTPLMRVLQALTYCGVLYVAFEARQRKRPVLLVGAYLLVVFAQGVAYSAKLGILIDVLLVIAVICVGYPTRFRRIDRRTLGGVVGGLLVVVLTFQVVTMLRHQGTTDESATTAYAVLGGPSAYSVVLEDGFTVNVDDQWGLTIAGIRDAVTSGSDTRALGVYAESVEFDPSKPAESRTNIYTWFMPLHHDFGVPGTFIVIFGLGLAASVTTRQPVAVSGSSGRPCWRCSTWSWYSRRSSR